jgi:hypothetical protein
VHLTQHVYTNKDPHHNTIYEILWVQLLPQTLSKQR